MSARPRLFAGTAPERVHTLFFVETPVLWGGPQKRLFRIARAWAARGHASAIASIRGDEHSSPAELAAFGVPVYQLTTGGKEVLKSFRLAAACSARKLHDRLRPELVVTMESLADYHARLGLIGREVPVVTLLGIGEWKWEAKPLRRRIVRRLARRRGAVLGNSRRCLAGWQRVLGDELFERTPHGVLHNPVDPDELTPLHVRDHGGELRVGGLGRFELQKGFDLLVEAFARLPERIGGRTVRLRLQGRGREERALRAQAERLGIAARVELAPFTTAIEPFLHDLDCLVVPSRWAGIENVALEGMLTGTPTLASTGTGLDELPPDPALRLCAIEPEDMARALRALLELGDAGRADLGRAQRAYVTRELDLHVVAERLERFLAEHGLLAAVPARM